MNVEVMLLVIACLVCGMVPAGMAAVVTDPLAPPRVQYGAARLDEALKAAGATAARVDVRVDPALGQPAEGFRIDATADGAVTVRGKDASGALYGCLDLADRVRAAGRVPADLRVADAPAFTLRGPCIGMQKTFILPGRKVYEYPYTPELFPFFYDKAFWTQYLDRLADNRMNTLFLWSGQPFGSLVRVQGYEYAQEVSDEVFARNVETYRWVAAEADRRGVWVVQNFYSILLPKPLADRHGLGTQLAAPVPVADDYTRKAIAEFVRMYPSVGVMPCMGEALQGIDNQRHWLVDVVLAGVKDGMAAAGMTAEPPVVVRTHATDLRQYLPDALKVYKNIYTEAKFNGESLTTHEPRGKRQQVHLAMSRLGSTHLINVHILANLEPFRYGAPRFIQRSVQAGRDRLGARGLHLYPLAYWSWPEAPDEAAPPLRQIDRDWIWFEAWARYAWQPDHDATADRAYWVDRLATMYGTPEAAGHILDAYNDSGECAPRILRRFGITEGNRQTMSLGMTLDELVNPEKYRPFEELWESQSPPGERLHEYVAREYKGEPHEGETPPQICADVLEFAAKAVAAIDAAAPHVTRNRAEFDRLRNDVYCVRAMSQDYAAKAYAAVHAIRYEHSGDVADLERAAAHLAESLEHYRELTRLTTGTYRFANTMQTNQRKIPITGGVDGKPAHYHWSQVLPVYEQELADFRDRVAAAKRGGTGVDGERDVRPLAAGKVRVVSPGVETFTVEVGARVFTDRPYAIRAVAPELRGLTGIRLSDAAARAGRYEPVELEAAEPVQVLIGYVKSSEPGFLKVPDLETDAGAAEMGGVEPAIRNAATIDGLPPLDVHAIRLGPGRQRLAVRGTGSFVVLGVVPQSTDVPRRDARRPGGK